jgi:bacillithiol system protein YtxJ
MTSQKLESIDQFEAMMNQEHEILFFKHSTSCPISKAAFNEYKKFLEAYPDVHSYYLYVQSARTLSNYIAEKYTVKHESPQAILFNNGNVKWHASHRKITEEALKNEIILKK